MTDSEYKSLFTTAKGMSLEQAKNERKRMLYEIMDRETIVCRCEGVTAGQMWDEMDGGIRSLTELKSTRFAMGYCQGRICEPIVSEMLRRSGGNPEEIGQLKLRLPLCPIPASVFEVNS